MKLVRYGAIGHEKPGLIDKDGQLRDLSGQIADLAGDARSRITMLRLAIANIHRPGALTPSVVLAW